VKKKMPMPVNLNDCVLLHQMGYRVEINDGKVKAVVKEGKKKNGLIAAINGRDGKYVRGGR
jgi:hypothetical protein